jgi:hypothetical protein
MARTVVRFKKHREFNTNWIAAKNRFVAERTLALPDAFRLVVFAAARLQNCVTRQMTHQ